MIQTIKKVFKIQIVIQTTVLNGSENVLPINNKKVLVDKNNIVNNNDYYCVNYNIKLFDKKVTNNSNIKNKETEHKQCTSIISIPELEKFGGELQIFYSRDFEEIKGHFPELISYGKLWLLHIEHYSQCIIISKESMTKLRLHLARWYTYLAELYKYNNTPKNNINPTWEITSGYKSDFPSWHSTSGTTKRIYAPKDNLQKKEVRRLKHIAFKQRTITENIEKERNEKKDDGNNKDDKDDKDDKDQIEMSLLNNNTKKKKRAVLAMK